MVKLASLLSRVRRPGLLGLRLTAAGWDVAHVHRENGHCRTGRTLAAAVAGNAFPADPAARGQLLARQLREAGIRERRCVVRVPAAWALAFTADVPDVAPEDLGGFLALRAEKEFACPPSELHLACSRHAAPGAPPRATVLALPEARMAAVRTLLEAAGCSALSVGLDLDPRAGDPAAPDGVDLVPGAAGVTVVIRAGGGIAGLHALPLPVPGEAELPGFAAALARELRIRLGQHADDVRASLQAARWLGAAPAPDRLRESLEPALHALGIEAPLQVLGAPAADPAAEAAASRLMGIRASFEFAAPGAPPRHAWQRRLRNPAVRRAAIAAGALLAVGLLTVGVRAIEVRYLAGREAAMRETVEQLGAIEAQIRQYRPWFDRAPTAAATLECLTAVFPEDGAVWARKIEMRTDGRIACSGMARTSEDVLAMLDRLRRAPNVRDVQVRQVRGNNPVQFAVDFVREDRHER